jgi:hypothetical protein
MQDQEATRHLEAGVSVTPEDIARAKSFILKAGGGRTDDLADRWLQDQGLTIPRGTDGDASNLMDVLANVARAFSIRLALYQA